MEKSQKNIWKIIAAFVGGSVVTALVMLATKGGLFQGALFTVTTPITTSTLSTMCTNKLLFKQNATLIPEIAQYSTYSEFISAITKTSYKCPIEVFMQIGPKPANTETKIAITCKQTMENTNGLICLDGSNNQYFSLNVPGTRAVFQIYRAVTDFGEKVSVVGESWDVQGLWVYERQS